jgi:hypothetical protein
MRTLENDVPEVLLELAREAFALGLFKVRLGFMYMGADFVSPIEWALWLAKRDGGDSDERSYLSPITVQRGSDEGATTYVASETDDWKDSTYWGPDEIRRWMREPLSSSDEYTPAWNPVTDPKLQEKLLEQWPLFELGVRSGWVMGHNVNWSEQERYEELFKKMGKELPEDYLPLLKLDWEASNSFYNYEGHESHRDTGAKVSTGGWSMLPYGKPEQFYRHDGSHPASLSREKVEELLGNTAPWFVRVAAFDEAKDEWLHYPEALQPAGFTVPIPLMKTREELKALAQESYVEYMMGNPYSGEAQASPTAQLTAEEREIYHEVVRELADERAKKRIFKGKSSV